MTVNLFTYICVCNSAAVQKHKTMKLQEILDFREEHPVPSTTHFITLDEWKDIAPVIFEHFTEFRAQKRLRACLPYKYRTNATLPFIMVELTISK